MAGGEQRVVASADLSKPLVAESSCPGLDGEFLLFAIFESVEVYGEKSDLHPGADVTAERFIAHRLLAAEMEIAMSGYDIDSHAVRLSQTVGALSQQVEESHAVRATGKCDDDAPWPQSFRRGRASAAMRRGRDSDIDCR